MTTKKINYHANLSILDDCRMGNGRYYFVSFFYKLWNIFNQNSLDK